MQNEQDIAKAEEIIEAILFGAGHPVTYEKLAEALEITSASAKQLVKNYEKKYNSPDGLPRGVQLITFDKACQLCTKSEYESQIKNALGIRQGKSSLSNSTIETLAIIAYHQPVTKAYIEQVRGVDTSYTLALLLEKNLIEKKGRLDVPGRPSLYGTTLDFLRCFGLNSLSQLPSVEELTLEENENGLSSEESSVSEDRIIKDENEDNQ